MGNTNIHGVYGSSWSWAYSGGAHLVADELIQTGEIPPVIIAMPSDGLSGDGSAYIDHGDRNFEKWIIDDVPAAAKAISSKFTDHSDMYISGLSMGGYGALRLAAKYPEKFKAISAHSSACEFISLQSFVEESLQDKFDINKDDYSPIYWFKKNADKLPPLRFDCGVDDQLIEFNRKLHAQLNEAGINHQYEEFPGAHTWDYWHDHLYDTLRFFFKR